MTLYKVLNQEKQIHTVLGGTYTGIKQGHYYYKFQNCSQLWEDEEC